MKEVSDDDEEEEKERNQLFYCSIILFILSPSTFLQPFFSSTNNFLQTFLGKIVSKLYSADDETEIKR